MELHLKDKIIVVSGGASGIGAAICETLDHEGAIPCIIDRNPGKYFTVQTELTQPHGCWQAIATITDKFGRIDGLVNNAGINDGVGLEHGNYKDFLRSLQRNAFHYYLLTQAAVPWLRDTRGAIVNIVSKVALTGQGNNSGYAAANGIRAEFTRAWAAELQPQDIRVNGIVVAECWTPQYAAWIGAPFDSAAADAKLASIRASIPLGNRLTRPEEIADMAVFLLSPKSSAMNGELLYIDGGYTHLDRRIRNQDAVHDAEYSNHRDHDHPFSQNE